MIETRQFTSSNRREYKTTAPPRRGPTTNGMRNLRVVLLLSCLLSTCRSFRSPALGGGLPPISLPSAAAVQVSHLRVHPLKRYSRRSCRLVLTAEDKGETSRRPGPVQRAIAKFKARPGTYLLIPCVAALVGWVTNWMAVQMIFYPIKFRGIPIYQRPEIPFGLLGWQVRSNGIIVVDGIQSMRRVSW